MAELTTIPTKGNLFSHCHFSTLVMRTMITNKYEFEPVQESLLSVLAMNSNLCLSNHVIDCTTFKAMSSQSRYICSVRSPISSVSRCMTMGFLSPGVSSGGRGID